MLKNKLKLNAKKINLFIKNYINNKKKSLLITPMNYGVLSSGKNKIKFNFFTGKLYKIRPRKLYNICGRGVYTLLFSYSRRPTIYGQ